MWISAVHEGQRVVLFPHDIMSYSLTVREKEHWKDRFAARIDKRIDALCGETSGFMEQVEKKARDRALESAGILKMQQKIDKIDEEQMALDERSNKILDEVDKKRRSVDAKVQPLLEKINQSQIELNQKERKLQDQTAKRKCLLKEKASSAIDEIVEERKLLDSRKRQTYREMLAKLRGISLREVHDKPNSPAWDIECSIEKRKSAEVNKILAKSARGKQIIALRMEKENLLDTVWLATSGKQIKELWETLNSLLGNTQTKLQREAAAIPAIEEE